MRTDPKKPRHDLIAAVRWLPHANPRRHLIPQLRERFGLSIRDSVAVMKCFHQPSNRDAAHGRAAPRS